MKKNFKTNKGITLIALIITIIVLLILAMVSIKLVWDGGIIEHSKNAVNAYNEAQQNEKDQITAAEQEMNKYGNNKTNTEDWYKLTEEEEEELRKHTNDGPLAVAQNHPQNISDMIGVAVIPNTCIVVWKPDGGCVFVPEEWKDSFVKEGLTLKETNKWYTVVSGNDFNQINEYTGKCPISITDFSEDGIFCKSYLERVIQSFNQ